MALSAKKSADSRGKNLILVSNNSDVFSEIPGHLLFGRSASKNGPDLQPANSTNLFQNFHDPEREKERGEREGRGRELLRRGEAVDEGQRYAQECLEYEKYVFDDKVRFIIHRMSILAYSAFKEKAEHVYLTFFIERMLCVLAKKLLLNKFELLFLEYVFEESKWRYDSELISSLAPHFKSFVHIYESENPHGMIKNLQIYLLFCSYYSKKSLNELLHDGLYTLFLRTLHDKFRERYQEWAESSGVTKIRINPKLLNLIFRKLTSFQDKEKDYYENYNLIVEEILEISPAYNADKDKRKKKRKPEQPEPLKDYESNNAPDPQPINSLLPEDSPPEFPPINFRKKQTSYVSNVDGLDPVAYYNRNP